jgi:hypothetical protein
MRLSAPKMITFLVALAVAIVAVLLYQWVDVKDVSDKAFWIGMASYVILAVATMVKGL